MVAALWAFVLWVPVFVSKRDGNAAVSGRERDCSGIHGN